MTQKQYIFPLLFFKRVSDIWNEEYQEVLELSDGWQASVTGERHIQKEFR